jgi:hypothetical protein
MSDTSNTNDTIALIVGSLAFVAVLVYGVRLTFRAASPASSSDALSTDPCRERKHRNGIFCIVVGSLGLAIMAFLTIYTYRAKLVKRIGRMAAAARNTMKKDTRKLAGEYANTYDLDHPALFVVPPQPPPVNQLEALRTRIGHANFFNDATEDYGEEWNSEWFQNVIAWQIRHFVSDANQIHGPDRAVASELIEDFKDRWATDATFAEAETVV